MPRVTNSNRPRLLGRQRKWRDAAAAGARDERRFPRKIHYRGGVGAARAAVDNEIHPVLEAGADLLRIAQRFLVAGEDQRG
jgi:hypothetical protein